jgi:high-affinity iron transporter
MTATLQAAMPATIKRGNSSASQEKDEQTKPLSKALALVVLMGAGLVAAMMIWEAMTSGGAPDPLRANASRSSAILDVCVLVFREGLECILVLAAITANMIGERRIHRKPVMVGASVGFAATWLTWVIAVRIMQSLSENVSALNLQAATGLLAVIVLLVVMNWFFHTVYWGGWINIHNRSKKKLLAGAESSQISHSRLIWGLALLGFASFYREGFEVVLFLQTYYLRLGGQVVFMGTMLGLFFTGIVAVLTFIAHSRLPYRKMLILTGIMLGGVLIVMIGEQAQEMQLAHWIPTTAITWLQPYITDWMGLWFAVFPTFETLFAQALAATLVIGSYFLAKSKTADHTDESPVPA